MATTQGSLNFHQESKHEVVQYFCDLCEYQATQQAHLKLTNNLSTMVKYPCNQCEYQATQQTHLKNHQQYKHKDVKYFCNKGEFKTGWKTDLNKHR